MKSRFKMKYDELLTLVRTGEGYTIELKETVNSTIGKEICAFANASGGKIIIGVDDKVNKVKGYNLTNKDKSKIQDIVRNMNPSFNVNIEQVEDLAVIYVPVGKNKPYTVNGHFYIRQGANSQQLNRDEIREFFQNENLISFEKQTVDFNIKDFSAQALKNFKKQSNLKLEKNQLLKNLNLTTNDTLNNAGILFFTKSVKKYFSTAIISCFLYSDKEQIDIIDSKEFTSDFKTNLEESYKYVISKLNNAILLDGSLRHKRKLELPKEALREAIVNAMIHKDYLFPANIQVNISPDKVEIINPGKLLFPKKEFGKTSAYRNPITADIMQRTGEIEKAGSGIKRIKAFCKKDNVRVKFETNKIFRTIFIRPKVDRDVDTIDIGIRHKSGTTLAQIRHKWILDYLKKNNQIKNSAITQKFALNRDTAREDLNYLIKNNKIVRKGGGNNVWYELKR